MLAKLGSVLLLTTMVGCGGAKDSAADAAVDAEGPPTLPNLAKLGIAGAGSLVLAPVAQARTSNPATMLYRLQRVNLDGTVAEVTIEDTEGNAVTNQVQVEKIIDAGTHLLFQVEITHPTSAAIQGRSIILTRKSDGAAHDVSPAMPTLGCHGYLQYSNIAFSDDHGGVYALIPCGTFQAENLVRIDTNASPPTAQLALPTDTHVNRFAVDADGNVAYVANASGTPGVYRAKSAAGQTKNLPMFSDPWTGPDGLVHFTGGTTDTCPATEGCTSDLVVGSGTIDVVIGAQGGVLGNFDQFARITAGTDSFVVSPSGPMGENLGGVTIARWRAGQSAPYQTTWTDHSMRAMAGSSTHVFVAGLDAAQNPVLGKFAMADLTAAPTTVIPDGLYDITKLSAAADGTLTFAGLRLADSREVVGRISPAGDVTISSEYMAAIGTLVPLN